ncbi:MAG: AMP-binding protein, partial [Marivita lacus]|nr:AMP-binding protein [Marivita lacus]
MANLLYDTLFGRHAGRTTPFLHLPDGTTLTHDTFLRMAARYANAMTAAGLLPGDRLAAQIEKSPEALAVYAACAQAGVIFLPLNTGYTSAELDYFIGNSGAKLVLVTDRVSEALAPVATAYGAILHTLNPDGTGSFPYLAKDLSEVFDTVSRAPDDLAAFLYTSGTTGRSKGAMLTHANLVSNAQTLADYWRFTDADVLLHALPIFHVHG